MRFLSATRVFSGFRYFPEPPVLVVDNQKTLIDVIPLNSIDPLKVENLKGTLTPGFVNAHCHLELSHMHRMIPTGTGLVGFAEHIMKLRDSVPAGQRTEMMQDADAFMKDRGIVAVGDISNDSSSFKVKTASSLHYFTFIELLGLNPAHASSIFAKGLMLYGELQDAGLAGALTPHAPYSVSPELVEQIAAFNQKKGLTLSIHNQESEEENKFFLGKPSQMRDLYKKLNLDISWFRAPGYTSLQYFMEFLRNCKTLLVHNTFTTSFEAQGCPASFSWCFCPTANKYIEGRLPEFSGFSSAAGRLCFGTDSLASNSDLDIVKEANLAIPAGVSVEQALSMLTGGGAEALGISDRFGNFAKGTAPGINLVQEENNAIRFLNKVL